MASGLIEWIEEREAWIGQMRIARSLAGNDGRNVSKAAILGVMYHLNRKLKANPEWYGFHQQMAAELGISEKVVSRAVFAAKNLGLISVELKKTAGSELVCNHYRIDWDEVKRRGAPIGHGGGSDRPPCPERSATETSQAVAPAEDKKRPIGHCGGSDRPRCPDRSAIVASTIMVVGDGESNTPSPAHHAPEAGDGVLRIHWGRRVEPRELLDPQALDRLYEVAATQGVAKWTDTDRLAFFALAAYCHRSASDGPKAVGLMTNLLSGRIVDLNTKSRDWRVRACQLDEDTARSWIARADRDGDPEDPPEPVAIDRGRSREQQVAAMLSRMTPEERRAFERDH